VRARIFPRADRRELDSPLPAAPRRENGTQDGLGLANQRTLGPGRFTKRHLCCRKANGHTSQNPSLPVRIETIGSETSFETMAPRLSVARAGWGVSSMDISKTLVFETCNDEFLNSHAKSFSGCRS